MEENKTVICPKCKQEVKVLTKDHILPKWLVRRLHILEVKLPKTLKKNNIQYICKKCNGKKGGKIDYSIPFVRNYMEAVANGILKKIKKYKKK